jgi:hypothetical protein
MFGRKKRFVQPDGIPNYFLAPSFDGSGAGKFVFEREFLDPVILVRGAGRVAGSLHITQPAQVHYTFRNTVAGIPQINGTFVLQPLQEQR